MTTSANFRPFSLFFLLAAVAVNGQPPPQTLPYAFNDTGPLSTYKSASRTLASYHIPSAYVRQRPDIFAPFLNMTLNDEALVTPGYIFLEPYQTTQPGPYLYDNAGVCIRLGTSRIVTHWV